jgi:Tol biopolymer transport system component
MKKIFAFLILVFVLSACTATAPVPPQTDTPGDTPTPAPTLMVKDTQSISPTPSNSSPTIVPIQHSSLKTSGPYLVYLRSQVDQLEIILTDADGIGQEIIPYPANANTQASQPSLNSLSPDGKWLAYYTGSAGECMSNGAASPADLTLNLLNLTDGNIQVITHLLSHDYPNNFMQAAQQLNQAGITASQLQNSFVCGITQSIAWSPDGKQLAFAGQMDGLSSDLYIYDLASQTIKRLSSGPEEVQMIAWSPDGQWILDWSSYGSGEGMTYNLYVTSLVGSDIHKLPVSSCDTARWLDDQTCFSSEDANGVGLHVLSLVNIKTGAVVPVWAGEFSSLAVSADHQWLAYFSHYSSQSLKTGSDPNFVPGLYLVNLGTLKSSRVELPGNIDDYRALQGLGSGDQSFGLLHTAGNALYFLSPGGKLSATGIVANSFALSPDKQTLVAIGQKIRILKADGTFLRDVDLPANLVIGDIGTIIWRPDSTGLFFTSLDPQSGFEQVYAMDLLEGEPHLVDNVFPPAGGPGGYVWVGMPK